MATTTSPLPEYVWLRRFAKLVCLSTLVLIFLGGQVKSHEAGLAVPDWPLTYGENPITYGYSKWVGGIFHEHFHRLIAGVVAAMTVVLAVWIGIREHRPRVIFLGAAAVVAVMAQALLGGLTVLYKLPVLISSAHGILAQVFLMMTVVLAYLLSREYRNRATEYSPTEPVSPLKRWSLLIVAAVLLQLFLGALMRHTESGLAVYDFPTTAGQWLPVVTDQTVDNVNAWRFDHTDAMGIPLPDVSVGQVWIHLLHRLGAVIVGTLVLTVAWLGLTRWGAQGPLRNALFYLAGLTVLQICLGAFTIWTAKLPLVTSFHVAVGAAVLAVATLLVLRAWPAGATARAPEALGFSAKAVA